MSKTRSTLIAILAVISLVYGQTTLVGSLRPVLECMINGETECIAFFGYLNEYNISISVPVGNGNKFSPSPVDRHQVTSFIASTRLRYVFNVTRPCSQGNLVWTLTDPITGSTRTSTAGTQIGDTCNFATPSVVEPPLETPITVPSEEPVASPSEEPVAAPVEEPLAAPIVQQPIAIPVAIPISAPVAPPRPIFCPIVPVSSCVGGLNRDGRSLCNANYSCVDSVCRGIDNAPCIVGTQCYPGYSCVNCRCQFTSGVDINAIVVESWPNGVSPSTRDKSCPLGRRFFDAPAGPTANKVQCLYNTAGTGNGFFSPGLENEPCDDPQAPSGWETERLTCSADKGFACVRGRCINQCNNVVRANCTSISSCPPGNICASDGKCFRLSPPQQCKLNSDCPAGYFCNACSCALTLTTPRPKCQTWNIAPIGDRLSSCKPLESCQGINLRCNRDDVLAPITDNMTIRANIWNFVNSPEADNWSDCGLAVAIQRHCK